MEDAKRYFRGLRRLHCWRHALSLHTTKKRRMLHLRVSRSLSARMTKRSRSICMAPSDTQPRGCTRARFLGQLPSSGPRRYAIENSRGFGRLKSIPGAYFRPSCVGAGNWGHSALPHLFGIEREPIAGGAGNLDIARDPSGPTACAFQLRRENMPNDLTEFRMRAAICSAVRARTKSKASCCGWCAITGSEV